MSMISYAKLWFSHGCLILVAGGNSAEKPDFSNLSADLSILPADFSILPADLSILPADLSILPADFSILPDKRSQPETK